MLLCSSIHLAAPSRGVVAIVPVAGVAGVVVRAQLAVWRVSYLVGV